MHVHGTQIKGWYVIVTHNYTIIKSADFLMNSFDSDLRRIDFNNAEVLERYSK